ncbi:MAG: TIGR04282 family arsenosugar biosynthesis glycosyltransferase [Burkholderiales bacterium]
MATHAFASAATRIVVFAKAPQPGQVKTRLIPALGASAAAALAQRMLTHTLAQAVAAQLGPVELCASPAIDHPDWHGVTLPNGVVCTAQGEGDLGARLARASLQALARSPAVLLIGTDCPALDAALLRQAAEQLRRADAVLLPATDGGYCLLGLKRHDASLFSQMPWSTPVVAALTLLRCAALGWQVWQGAALTDIDEPADLAALPAGWLPRLAV